MKENKLSIVIEKPARDVFAFVIDPKNTPKWISSIVEERASEWPIRVGTKYRNMNHSRTWFEYIVSDVEPNKVFEMIQDGKSYHVRYTCTELSPSQTRLEYFEWQDTGDLEVPFSQSVLDGLKKLLESDEK